jgi:hypothetical protein
LFRHLGEFVKRSISQLDMIFHDEIDPVSSPMKATSVAERNGSRRRQRDP